MNYNKILKKVENYFKSKKQEEIDSQLLSQGFEFEKSFVMNANEVKKQDRVLTDIKKKYGSYGKITYSFTPLGMGNCVEIKSSHSKEVFDITDYSSF